MAQVEDFNDLWTRLGDLPNRVFRTGATPLVGTSRPAIDIALDAIRYNQRERTHIVLDYDLVQGPTPGSLWLTARLASAANRDRFR